MATEQKIVASSGFTGPKKEKLLLHLAKIQSPKTTFAELQEHGSYEKIHDQLLSAILSICSGDLGRDIMNKLEETRKQHGDKTLTGAQALWMIARSHDVEENSEILFDITDLGMVEFNDKDLEKSLRNWNYVINGLQGDVDVKILFFDIA